MLKLLHTADLHLSAGPDLEYSLNVLNEIEALAIGARVEAILLCGDIFDTYKDLLALKDHLIRFAQRAAIPTLYIPGNHEDLGKPGNVQLGDLNLSPIRFLATSPYQHELIQLADGRTLDVLAIPHQNTTVALNNALPLPPRSSMAHSRIVLAHGFVHGMAFFQKDAEEGGTIFDASFFSKLDCDYVALGHVHSKRHQTFDRYTAAYPGSPRVWRRGEKGVRSVNLVTFTGEQGHSVHITEEPITSAGEYRLFEIEIDQIDSLRADGISTSRDDYVEFKVRGVVDHEFQKEETTNKLKQAFGGNVRKLAVSTDTVIVLEDLVKEPLAKKFLEKWASVRPQHTFDTQDSSYKAWLSARDQFFSELKKHHVNSASD